jgi:hypothetical protein
MSMNFPAKAAVGAVHAFTDDRGHSGWQVAHAAGNAVMEAGLVAQLKTPKAVAAPDQDRAQAGGPLS